MISNCPICGCELERKAGEADYYCLNPNCEAKHLEGLIHFASREAYDIDGLGEAILTELYNDGYVKEITDIFRLNQYREDLIKKERFGEKSVENLINAINNAKSNNLDKLLFGLGIRHVGAKTARILAQNHGNIFDFFNMEKEDLESIKDIGKTTAKSVYDYFHDEKNQIMIENLNELGVNLNYKDSRTSKETAFTGKSFVITGTLDEYSRNEAKAIIEQYGGNVSSAVSKNTDYVIVGQAPGSKYDKAQSLGIDILNEDDFKKMIENR
jgi:DNA ligase (NAD+)